MTRTYDPQLEAEDKLMDEEEIIEFAQFLIDRLFGHQLTDQIIRNCLRDFLRDKKDGWTKQTWSKK